MLCSCFNFSRAWVDFQLIGTLPSLQQKLKLTDTHPVLREAITAEIVM